MSKSPLPRLFVIGDSISIHYGPWLERLLEGRFHYDRKRDTGGGTTGGNLDVPEGANGGDSSMVLAYLQNRRENHPIEADFMLLNCGLHDIKTAPTTGKIQISPEEYAANLYAILGEIRKIGCLLLWVNTTPVIDEIHNTRTALFQRSERAVKQYNEIADQIMRAAKVEVIDLHLFSKQFLPEGFCDHVHYTDEVRAVQAAYLAGVLGRFENLPTS